jgi:adenylate cyclase
MWSITIRSPGGEPRQYQIHSGSNSIGRMAGNDIVILDPSASRYHARIDYLVDNGTIVLYDLDSTNGTFLNRIRLTEQRQLKNNDAIRIGLHTLEISQSNESIPPELISRPHYTHQLTRELVLESIDQHGVLLAEVASKLNTILDLDTALQTVSNLMKIAMGADRCEVILKEKFDQLSQLGFARTIAQQAIQTRSAVTVQDAQSGSSPSRSATLLNIHAAMCVPVLSGDDMLGLIYVFKNRPQARSFSQRDLQLAIAIGNQAALTIQRMQLLERVRQEEVISRLLHRFLSPQEAEYILEEFQETGQMPGMDEHNITIVATDICDSTKLSERLGAKRFSRVLENYYKEMTDVVFDNQGTLNKYIGDGLMAVFGMPHQPANPAERAVKAGIEMMNKLDYLNQMIGENIQIGMGINTGPAMAGYVGTSEYIEFSVIGYPVNIAWGLETMARPNRIFIGHPTYQAVSGLFNIKPLGFVEIKKQTGPIQAYEVLRSNNQV